MKIRRALTAVLVCTLTTACDPPPEFTTSLSDPGEAAYDEWVLGNWYQTFDGGAVIYATIAEARDNRGQEAVAPPHGLRIGLFSQNTRSEEALNLLFDAFPGQVDGAVYYSVAHANTPFTWEVTAPGDPAGYYIVRVFNLTPETMLVCLLTNLSDTDLLGSGLTMRKTEQPIRLNGNPLENGDDWEHRLVDGSRDDLHRLVRRDPPAHFAPALYLARIGTPWTDPEDDPEQWARITQHRDECAVDELRDF